MLSHTVQAISSLSHKIHTNQQAKLVSSRIPTYQQSLLVNWVQKPLNKEATKYYRPIG